MPMQPYMATVTVGANYAPLAATPTRLRHVTIQCPPGNAGVVTFKDPAGHESDWQKGEWNVFEDVDLADFQVKGTPGDTVTQRGS